MMSNEQVNQENRKRAREETDLEGERMGKKIKTAGITISTPAMEIPPMPMRNPSALMPTYSSFIPFSNMSVYYSVPPMQGNSYGQPYQSSSMQFIPTYTGQYIPILPLMKQIKVLSREEIEQRFDLKEYKSDSNMYDKVIKLLQALTQVPLDEKSIEEMLESKSLGINTKFKRVREKKGSKNKNKIDYVTLLNLAIENPSENAKEIVSLLIQYGANYYTSENSAQNSPLHLAASMGKDDIVNVFISCVKESEKLSEKLREYINKKNRRGKIALHFAVQNGYPKVVETLLKHNADHSITAYKSSSSSYELAVNLAKCTGAAFTKLKKMHPNDAELRVQTILIIFEKYLAITKTEIKKETSDPRRFKPQDYPHDSKEYQCVDQLFQGIEQEQLDYNLIKERLYNYVSLGLSIDAKFDMTENDWSKSRTILGVMIELHSTDPQKPFNMLPLIEVLHKKYYADFISPCAESRMRPLHLASRGGKADIVKYILDDHHLAKQINYQDSKGKTALDIATENGYSDVAQILLDAGANYGKKYSQENVSLKPSMGTGVTLFDKKSIAESTPQSNKIPSAPGM